MLTSVVSYKQRLLHETRWYNHFIITNAMVLTKAVLRKPLQSSAKNLKNNYGIKTRSFLPAVQSVTSLNV